MYSKHSRKYGYNWPVSARVGQDDKIRLVSIIMRERLLQNDKMPAIMRDMKIVIATGKDAGS